MTKSPQLLTELPGWQKLLTSADNSLGKTTSYYESPEPELCDELIAEWQEDKASLVEQAREILARESQADAKSETAWATLKEVATLLYHLKLQGYVPEDKWESVINQLWQAMGAFGQDKWSDYTHKKNTEEVPIAWKRKKFALDALLTTLRHINQEDEDRIERFFNSNLSPYWMAYLGNWDMLWGDYQEDRERYFHENGTRDADRLATYQLMVYRLEQFQQEFPAHIHKSLNALDYLKNNPDSIPSEKQFRRNVFHAIFSFLSASGEELNVAENVITAIEILGRDDSFDFVIGYEELEAAVRGWLLLSFDDLEVRWRTSNSMQQKMLPDLLTALTHDDLNVRDQAITFLKPRSKELFKYLRHKENEGEGIPTFQALCLIYEQDIVQLLLRSFAFTPPEKGKFLLHAPPRILEGRWEEKTTPNYQDMLPFILAVVESGEESCQEKASTFLKRKSTVIQKQLDDLIDSLDQNEEKASEMIASAIEFGSDSALKAILEKCTLWLACKQNGTLVDRAAQKARETPEAVLALVNLLNSQQELHKQPEVQAAVSEKVLEDQKKPVLNRIFAGQETAMENINSAQLEELYKWCCSLKGKSKAYMDLVVSSEKSIRDKEGLLEPEMTLTLTKSLLELLEQEEMEARELSVQKWLTQILSEMSDSWFFEGNREVYARTKRQLERLAVEPLSKRLPQEENLDIRENIVKILGNIGGRVAVDALVRAATGEERERAARQELLSEYYLKPSKARSEEAAVLLQGAVDNAKKTMRLLQNLNMATFALGAILILGGVAIAAVSEGIGGRLTGGLAGLGGLTAVLTQFMKDPLERIQRAMADLVQIQTAFTSFIWELNLNGTYIQSQYVSEGVLTDFDIRQTVDRIDHAMERTMNLIHVYADGQAIEEDLTTKALVLETLREVVIPQMAPKAEKPAA